MLIIVKARGSVSLETEELQAGTGRGPINRIGLLARKGGEMCCQTYWHVC